VLGALFGGRRQEIDARWTEVSARIETIAIRPEATDVRVERLTLVWVPTP
jgi:hypothetical protein